MIAPDAGTTQHVGRSKPIGKAQYENLEEERFCRRKLESWRRMKEVEPGRVRFAIEIDGMQKIDDTTLAQLTGPQVQVRKGCYDTMNEVVLPKGGKTPHWVVETERDKATEAWSRAHLAKTLNTHLNALEKDLKEGEYSSWSVYAREFTAGGETTLALSTIAADHDNQMDGYESDLVAAVEETLSGIETARWLCTTHLGYTPMPMEIIYAGASATAYLGWVTEPSECEQWGDPALVNAVIEQTLQNHKGEHSH